METVELKRGIAMVDVVGEAGRGAPVRENVPRVRRSLSAIIRDGTGIATRPFGTSAVTLVSGRFSPMRTSALTNRSGIHDFAGEIRELLHSDGHECAVLMP